MRLFIERVLFVEKIFKETLENLYCYENLSDSNISVLYSCNKTTILNLRKKYNIKKLYRDKEWLNKKYNIEKLTVREISKIINCSEDTVSIYLRKFGYKIDHERARIAGKKYHYNERIFHDIDTAEKAYWLGFITADGCIENIQRKRKDGTIYDNYRLCFCLSKKDENHLKKFRKFIGDTSISITDSKTFLSVTNKEYDCVHLRIYCKQLAIDLMKHNVLQNKSTKEHAPILNDNLNRHFIRGVFDGDGCIVFTTSIITIVGSLELMSYIKANVSKHMKYECGYIHRDSKSKNLYSYSIYKKHDIEAFLQYIYTDNTINLDRKYKIYKKFANNNFYVNKRYSPTSD